MLGTRALVECPFHQRQVFGVIGGKRAFNKESCTGRVDGECARNFHQFGQTRERARRRGADHECELRTSGFTRGDVRACITSSATKLRGLIGVEQGRRGKISDGAANCAGIFVEGVGERGDGGQSRMHAFFGCLHGQHAVERRCQRAFLRAHRCVGGITDLRDALDRVVRGHGVAARVV